MGVDGFVGVFIDYHERERGMSLFEYYWEGRRPSYKSVLKVAVDAIRDGNRKLELSWGENMITLEVFNGIVYGYGWIKVFGGDDMAKELNTMRLGI